MKDTYPLILSYLMLVLTDLKERRTDEDESLGTRFHSNDTWGLSIGQNHSWLKNRHK